MHSKSCNIIPRTVFNFCFSLSLKLFIYLYLGGGGGGGRLNEPHVKSSS